MGGERVAISLPQHGSRLLSPAEGSLATTNTTTVPGKVWLLLLLLPSTMEE